MHVATAFPRVALRGGIAQEILQRLEHERTEPSTTPIGTLEETVKEHKLWKHTLFLVGPALDAEGTRSHLYHPGHFHGYRKADPEARRALRSRGAST